MLRSLLLAATIACSRADFGPSSSTSSDDRRARQAREAVLCHEDSRQSAQTACAKRRGEVLRRHALLPRDPVVHGAVRPERRLRRRAPSGARHDQRRAGQGVATSPATSPSRRRARRTRARRSSSSTTSTTRGSTAWASRRSARSSARAWTSCARSTTAARSPTRVRSSRAGNSYLDKSFPDLSKIVSARVVEPSKEEAEVRL